MNIQNQALILKQLKKLLISRNFHKSIKIKNFKRIKVILPNKKKELPK